jgi:hypothetical protein
MYRPHRSEKVWAPPAVLRPWKRITEASRVLVVNMT